MTPDSTFITSIIDKTNWSNQDIEIDTEDEIIIHNKTTVEDNAPAVYNFDTDATRWVFSCDIYLTADADSNSATYATASNSFLFDASHAPEYDYTYRIEKIYSNPINFFAPTYYHNPEQSLDGSYMAYMPLNANSSNLPTETRVSLILTRWDNTYTLYLNDAVMWTIPTKDPVNAIGLITRYDMLQLINPTLYILDDESDATNIFIETTTSDNQEMVLTG